MSRYLTDRIDADPRIHISANARIVALDGDQTLRSITIATPGETTTVESAGLFSFIGAEPSSEWLSGCAVLDKRGFVLTDRSIGDEDLDRRWDTLGRRAPALEASLPRPFAGGDVRAGSPKRGGTP